MFKNYSNFEVKLTYLLNSWHFKTALGKPRKVESSESLSELRRWQEEAPEAAQEASQGDGRGR